MSNVANVRRAVAVLVAGSCLASLALPAVGAAAATRQRRPAPASGTRAQKAAVDARIRALQGQLDEVDAAEADLQARLDRAAAAKAALDRQVAALDSQLGAATAALARAQATVAAATAQLQDVRDRLERAHRAEDEARRQLSSDAVGAYIGQPSTGLAAIVLDTRTVAQAQALTGYLDAVLSLHTSDIRRFHALKVRTAALAAEAQATEGQAVAGRNAVVDQEARLASARGAVAAARQSQAAQEAGINALYAEAARQKAQLGANLAALRAESDRIAALLRAAQRNQAPAAVATGRLYPPVPGAPITSRFGMRYDPVVHEWMLHSGIDFGAPYGTPIHAAADGVVVAAGPMGGYGNATVINHGGSLATLYGHQEQILVSDGEHVTRGEVIGLVGCTGWCTGPHVHFEVRINGTPVDPAPYL